MRSIALNLETSWKCISTFNLLLIGTLALGCSSKSDSNSNQGGVVGFVTGTTTAGPVPSSAAPTAATPVVTALTAASATIVSGQALRVSITFTDTQGDVAFVNFGIAGESSHAVLSVAGQAAGTSGTLTLDIYPAKYVPGTYVLMVSLTDAAGNVSAVATLTFVISGGAVPVGTGGTPLRYDAGSLAGAGGGIDATGLGTGGASGTRLDAGIGTDTWVVTPVLDAAVSGQEAILFKMDSVQGVSYNPPVATTFTLSTVSYITRVWTYHYSSTIGTKSPTVAFKDTATGTIYGPWAQVGYKTFNGTLGATKSDPGNAAGPPDNYWMAYPAQLIPAGTYQVIDSDPATWAYTADLGNRGCTWVYGWSVGGGIDAGPMDATTVPAVDANPSTDAPTTNPDGAADAPAGPAWSAPVLLENAPSSASAPKMAMDSKGNIIAVWVQGDGTVNDTSSIYANRYAAGGGWGTPTLLETSDMPADSPMVAFDSNDNAMAVWHQAWKTVNGARYGLYSNRYVPGVGWGAVSTVMADTSNSDATADGPYTLSFDGNGNAIVTWTFYEWSWNHTSVHTTRYVAGTGWAASEIIDTGTTSAFSPAAALDTAGNAIVLWVQSSNSADTVFSNRYVPGSGWGTAVTIDSAPRGNAKAPSIAFAPDGSAMAIWYNYGLRGINVNRYVTGKGWGTSALLTEAGDSGYDEGAQFAYDTKGNAMAVWNRYGGGVFASRYDAAGTTWTTPVAIESGGADYSEQPAFFVGGSALTVWARYAGNSYNIWSSLFAGSTWGTPIMVNTTPDNCSDPHMVISKTGVATAIWIQSGSLYAANAAF